MKFNLPSRYDLKLAAEGVWFNISDTSGNEYGSFKCVYLDKTAKSTSLVYKRIRQNYSSELRSMKPEDLAKVAFVEAHLKDWRDVPITGDDGKPVPFSKKAAIEFFSYETKDHNGEPFHPTLWILDQLAELSVNEANFVAAEEETVEAIEKN